MSKENILSAAIFVSVIFVGAVASGLAGFIVARWPTIEAPIKPAIVSGAFTIVAAMGGALVVFWQLRRQAVNTIAANKHNEAMKLRKEVYEDAAKLILDAENATAAMNETMRSMLVKAQGDISLYQGNRILPHWPEQPDHESLQRVREATRKLCDFIDKWTIMDVRLRIFRVAMQEDLMAIEYWQRPYLNSRSAAGPSRSGEWSPDHVKVLEQLWRFAPRLMGWVDVLRNHISDFQIEIQNKLLSDLFDQSLPRRMPEDQSDIVLRLDHYDKLQARLDGRAALRPESFFGAIPGVPAMEAESTIIPH